MILEYPSVFSLDVQFEDVDSSGVVHHPNYLKYLERARLWGIKKCGYSIKNLFDSGYTLAISEIQANYLRPALIEQKLFVITRIIDVGKSSIKIYQCITSVLPEKEELVAEKILSLSNVIFSAKIKLVCVDFKYARAKSIPKDFKLAIKNFNHD